jgi:hypothetical protein
VDQEKEPRERTWRDRLRERAGLGDKTSDEVATYEVSDLVIPRKWLASHGSFIIGPQVLGQTRKTRKETPVTCKPRRARFVVVGSTNYGFSHSP